MHTRRSLTLVAIGVSLMASPPTQAATILFNLEGLAGTGLLPGNEVPSAIGTGSGGILTGISFDTDTSILSLDVGWGSGNGFSDMTGAATVMHLHGPADFASNAGVKYGLDGLAGFDSSASSGGFTGTVTIAGGDVADLQNGLFYINVHTSMNPGGELRGNLVLVPEPSSTALLGLGCLAMAFRRRRA
ncbi:CHRD domain-containing protein [Oceaniferula spumae]|uniref:CHRD domain-containing protein n=1 Tax=Oceaniferula spumae TaxID=2979115 RepID=A0AAT9FKI8_9BACT